MISDTDATNRANGDSCTSAISRPGVAGTRRRVDREWPKNPRVSGTGEVVADSDCTSAPN